ncbi:AAA family ATPase [Micromonospora zhanjiangensis]
MRGGDPRDLFWDGYRDHEHRIKLAAEMIVPTQVEDDLGAPAKPTTTFLRYEVTLGFERPVNASSLGRLSLLGEELRHIRRGEAAHHLRFGHSAGRFRGTVISGDRRSAFLSTEHREGGTVINVHPDGESLGRPHARAAGRAGRTVLSTVTTNDYPTILAARREMQSWRRLALEPTALRTPDGLGDPRTLGTDGRHLAAALYRIAHGSTSDGTDVDPEAVYARVAGRLADLSGVGVEGLTVELDPVREVFTLLLEEKGDLRLPARALSEGTLRFLALCVLLEDPTFTGLIAMEEPENGIHPANLPAMVELVRDLAVNPYEAPDDDNPFRQVIVNTHSPGVVQLCKGDDLLLAEVRARRTTDGGIARALSLLPFRGSWRAKSGEPTFSEADVVAFLAAPPGAQLRLPLDMVG